MVHQRNWTVPGSVLLPLSVVVGYELVTGLGFLWPEHPWVAIVGSITVSILLWLVATLWFHRRTRWWRTLCLLPFAAVFVFPMVGAASLGTDMALEKHAELVGGEVADIAVEQTNHREGRESYRTTYTFVASEDGRELGTVDYRGSRDAYDLEVGDSTDLLVDPSGELPLKLADRVDSGDDIAMVAIGGVLFVIVYSIGLCWPMVRRPDAIGRPAT
ncbi:hypothetical protein [Nocardioides jensenii]|uniref:hypothetical protein n=1 Tax=Nocardioides jensenii TaxID=1843 RepID=UPI0012F88E02|nr:hypothetical protein [Nocardioides jensenii]